MFLEGAVLQMNAVMEGVVLQWNAVMEGVMLQWNAMMEGVMPCAGMLIDRSLYLRIALID